MCNSKTLICIITFNNNNNNNNNSHSYKIIFLRYTLILFEKYDIKTPVFWFRR